MQITGNNSWLATYRLPFSWSYTRGQTLTQCKRQYYYRYYAPYGGNAPDETDDRALILVLGRLTSPNALLGSIIHHVARDSLSASRSGRIWDDSLSIASARTELQHTLRRSENSCRKGPVSPRQIVLQSHFFGYPLDESALVERLDFLVRALLDHPVYRELQTVAERIKRLDEVLQFSLAGVPVFAVPDVLLAETAGYRLIDWKTSASIGNRIEQAAEQLLLYALYVVRVEAVQADKIDCEVVEVAFGTSRRWTVSDVQLRQVERKVEQSVIEMQSLLQDPVTNRAAKAALPKRTESIPGDTVCAHCSFRILCFGVAPEP